MTILLVLGISAAVLFFGGRVYSRFLARSVGEDPSRATPAVLKNDGRDYVPSPTPVVFAHHFAAIAGAGPILGPVIALIYGWLPALIWVVVGGLTIGAVHDYLATYIATREGGQSVATIARRMMGQGVFVAFTIFLILMLVLVCATFLNTSATALMSTVPLKRADLPADQTLFNFTADGENVVIGGIASMSVVVLTLFAPVLGWMYIKRNIAVWKCSLAAIVVCAASIVLGIYFPISFADLQLGGLFLQGVDVWKLLLSVYVLLAAGVPVWIFLQSRDFINVHILYAGLGVLLIALVVGAFRAAPQSDPIPPLNIAQGTQAMGMFWPGMFILVACGAVSGFHSLCAGGTTCKQITSEVAARRIGYFAMLLESLVAVAVIAVMMLGTSLLDYKTDVHKTLLNPNDPAAANPIIAFAMATGSAISAAFSTRYYHVPKAVGALAGMIMLEGFLITTLDAAVRLTRYLFEEVWRSAFGRYDVFAASAAQAAEPMRSGDDTPAGDDGIPLSLPTEVLPREAAPIATRGLFRQFLKLLRHYWFNSGLAVGLMLLFALNSKILALWGIFATSNQLLAAMVLSLASLWLLRHGKRVWFAFVPAVGMMVTTCTSLGLLMATYVRKISSTLHELGAPGLSSQKVRQLHDLLRENITLSIADVLLSAVTVYLLIAGVRAAVAFFRNRKLQRAEREVAQVE